MLFIIVYVIQLTISDVSISRLESVKSQLVQNQHYFYSCAPFRPGNLIKLYLYYFLHFLFETIYPFETYFLPWRSPFDASIDFTLFLKSIKLYHDTFCALSLLFTAACCCLLVLTRSFE